MHNVSDVSLKSDHPRILSRTELDSHAASIVVGSNVLVLCDTGKAVDVGPFTKSLGSLKKVKVVDCAIAHDCPYSGNRRLIIMYNALHVPEMNHNLVPPFVIRRRGNVVSDVPKIHCQHPTENDHTISFEDTDVRITLQLVGTTSYFDSEKPTLDEIAEALESDSILELNLDEEEWDPHNPDYARQESLMLDFEGKIVEQRVRDRELLRAKDLGDDQDNDFLGISGIHHEHERLKRDNDYELSPVGLSNALQELDDLNESYRRAGISVGEANKMREDNDDPFSTISALSSTKPTGVTPKELSKIFRIDEDRARRTINSTTQRLRRSKNPTLSRRYSTNDRTLRYRHVNELFYTDTFFATGKAHKTKRGNSCMQLFVTDTGFVHVVPMTDKSGVSVAQAMRDFFRVVGIPDAFIRDKSPEQNSGEARKLCNKVGVTIRALEPNTPWANRAEVYVGIFKDGIRKELRRSNCPIVLWDYCAEHRALVNNATVSNLAQTKGLTPYQQIFNEEADISDICQFGFYDWGMYREPNSPDTKFPLQSELLCRVLTPSKNVGNKMCKWILRVDGRIVPRSTVRPLTEEDNLMPNMAAKKIAFDNSIRDKLGDAMSPPPKPLVLPSEFDHYEDMDEAPQLIPDLDNDEYDYLINAEVLLPHNEQIRHATVLGPSKDSDGNEKGRYDSNPILNTKIYDVMFPDGAVKQYAANTIAENMWAEVDQDGYQYKIMDCITGHRTNSNAVDRSAMYINDKKGKRLRQTTVGWDLSVLWKDGT